MSVTETYMEKHKIGGSFHHWEGLPDANNEWECDCCGKSSHTTSKGDRVDIKRGYVTEIPGFMRTAGKTIGPLCQRCFRDILSFTGNHQC